MEASSDSGATEGERTERWFEQVRIMYIIAMHVHTHVLMHACMHACIRNVSSHCDLPSLLQVRLQYLTAKALKKATPALGPKHSETLTGNCCVSRAGKTVLVLRQKGPVATCTLLDHSLESTIIGGPDIC